MLKTPFHGCTKRGQDRPPERTLSSQLVCGGQWVALSWKEYPYCSASILRPFSLVKQSHHKHTSAREPLLSSSAFLSTYISCTSALSHVLPTSSSTSATIPSATAALKTTAHHTSVYGSISKSIQPDLSASSGRRPAKVVAGISKFHGAASDLEMLLSVALGSHRRQRKIVTVTIEGRLFDGVVSAIRWMLRQLERGSVVSIARAGATAS